MSQHSNSLATVTAAILVHNEKSVHQNSRMAKGRMQALYQHISLLLSKDACMVGVTSEQDRSIGRKGFYISNWWDFKFPFFPNTLIQAQFIASLLFALIGRPPPPPCIQEKDDRLLPLACDFYCKALCNLTCKIMNTIKLN